MTLKDRLKDIIAFIKTKLFLKHLAIAFGGILVFLIIIYYSLSAYTNHGNTVTTPNFKGLTPDKLEAFVEYKNVRYAISDSSYNANLPKGTVIDQDPDPGAIVKIGRTIYLSINSLTPPQTKLPNVLNNPYINAKALLTSAGLRIGKLIYKPNLNKDAVLEVYVGGKATKPGEAIKKESVIDLVLGDGLGYMMVAIPDLTSLTLEEAHSVLKGSRLNEGAITYEGIVKDSSRLVIIRQIPAANGTDSISQGETIDLFLAETPQ